MVMGLAFFNAASATFITAFSSLTFALLAGQLRLESSEIGDQMLKIVGEQIPQRTRDGLAPYFPSEPPCNLRTSSMRKRSVSRARR